MNQFHRRSKVFLSSSNGICFNKIKLDRLSLNVDTSKNHSKLAISVRLITIRSRNNTHYFLLLISKSHPYCPRDTYFKTKAVWAELSPALGAMFANTLLQPDFEKLSGEYNP